MGSTCCCPRSAEPQMGPRRGIRCPSRFQYHVSLLFWPGGKVKTSAPVPDSASLPPELPFCPERAGILFAAGDHGSCDGTEARPSRGHPDPAPCALSSEQRDRHRSRRWDRGRFRPSPLPHPAERAHQPLFRDVVAAGGSPDPADEGGEPVGGSPVLPEDPQQVERHRGPGPCGDHFLVGSDCGEFPE